MGEMRQSPRVEEASRIAIRILQHTEVEWQGAATYIHDTLDISRNGMSFRTYVEIPLDTALKIEVMLDDPARSLSLSGIVRWAATVGDDDLYSIGVELVDLINPDGQYWTDFVDSRCSAL